MSNPCYECPDIGSEICALPTGRERLSQVGEFVMYLGNSLTATLAPVAAAHAARHISRQDLVGEVEVPVPSRREKVRDCQQFHAELDEILR